MSRDHYNVLRQTMLESTISNLVPAFSVPALQLRERWRSPRVVDCTTGCTSSSNVVLVLMEHQLALND